MYLVLCEDEPEFAEELGRELKGFFEKKEIECEISCCGSGEAFRAELERKVPIDLLFMDIHLGDADGVELVKELNQNNVRVPTVFLSSLEDRVTDGYEVSAFHFLYKRDYKKKLDSVLERFLKECYCCKRLVLNHQDTTVMLRFSEIYYAEPAQRNTAIYTAVSCYQEKRSIQNFAKQLPEDCFIEAYHSLYINVDHIRKVTMDSVVLDNDKELPVSRRKRKQLMAAVMRRIRNR